MFLTYWSCNPYHCAINQLHSYIIIIIAQLLIIDIINDHWNTLYMWLSWSTACIPDSEIIPYTRVHVPVKVWYETCSVLFYQSKVISLHWPRCIPCFKHFSVTCLFIASPNALTQPCQKPADLTAQRLEFFFRYLN